MQLILNTETTVDIKTKMSLHEENLEMCVTNVLPVFQNGDITNGDLLNGNFEAGDNKDDDKKEQGKKIEKNSTDGELKPVKKDVPSNNADIEMLSKNNDKTRDASDIMSEKDCVTNESSIEQSNDVEQIVSTEIISTEINVAKDAINSSAIIADDKEQIQPVSIGTEKESYDAEDAINSSTGASSIAEKENVELVSTEVETEFNVNNSPSKSCKNANLSITVEKEHVSLERIDTEIELKDVNSTVLAGAAKIVSVEINHTEPVINKILKEITERNTSSNSSADASEAVDKDQAEFVSAKTEIELNDINVIEDVDESVCLPVIPVKNVTETKLIDCNSSCNSSTIDRTHVELGSNTTEMEINYLKEEANCSSDNSADVSESSSTGDKTHVEHLSKETTININETKSTEDVSESIAVMNQQTEPCNNDIEIKTKDINSVINASGDETYEKEHNDNLSDGMEIELNDSSGTIVENDTVTVEKEHIASVNPKFSDDHMVSEVKDIVDSMDSEQNIADNTNSEKIDADICMEENNLEEKKDPIIKKSTIEKNYEIETPENKSVLEETSTVEITENNISVKHTDSVKLDDSKKSENVNVCVKKEIESEKYILNDPEEKNVLESDKDDVKENWIHLMDVNESTLVNDPSKLNGASEHTLSVDCNIIEPINTKNNEMDVVADSSDDIIFNLDDDDMEPSTDVADLKHKKVTDRVNKTGRKSLDEIIDLDEAVPDRTSPDSKESSGENKEQPTMGEESKLISPVLKLSNTLDILSDEEDEPKETSMDNKCINIEDDDDVMLIDDNPSVPDSKTEPTEETECEGQKESKQQSPAENMEVIEKNKTEPNPEKEALVPEKEVLETTQAPEVSEKSEAAKTDSYIKKPLMQEKFLKTCKKNLADMSREELEEFCILKIVESVLDRSNLNEIRATLKTLTQNVEDYKKKAMMLTKQNRDLQVVLKSIQEDQKKGTQAIVPLKITRSVGMQVLMADKTVQRRKVVAPPNTIINKPLRNPVIQNPRLQKPPTPHIPVPRLVPANNPTLKSPNTPQANTGKITSPLPNGIKNASPVQKGEKRTHNRIQSVTVDLTDDEPPAKVINRAQSHPVPPVRLVPSQNLLASPRPAAVNSPRKVYIPISGPQGQNVRPGQTIMLKTVSTSSPRQRCAPPHMLRMPQTMRMSRPQGMRHPAPLPDCMKQYQPPNWKALPPAPDLKLAKVENGIVISWKIEGYQEDSYEEIASYQLYAYQETSSPPSTALWKKIGDVKALPLPMACTLTQFMAGYKYYFAVRAVDIRSRLGPFSLPGSILLLNKM